MDWTPLSWLQDVALFVSGLPRLLLLKVLLLAAVWALCITYGILWLRSPEAPSLDDQEPRGNGKR